MRQMPDRRSRSDRDRRCTGFGASTVSCPSCIPPDMNSLAEEMEDRYCGELSSASTVPEVPAFAGRKKLPEKDFPVSRLPATLSLHVKRSPQQVINSPDSPKLWSIGREWPNFTTGIPFSARTLRVAGKTNHPH